MSIRPLIPRRKLFDNPTFFDAKLSPDSRLISWLAPADGVLNVWVSPADNIAAGQPVTRTKGRPIGWSAMEDWRETQDLLAQYAKLKPQPDLNVYYTNSFLSEAPYSPKK